MQIMMRLQRVQVQELYVFKDSGTFTRPDLAMMAGYRSFRALLVGGSGGYSGRAQSKTNSSNARRYMYGGGGGGGGSLELWGNLSDLASSEAVTVGEAGANGANGGDNATAPDGSPGTSSAFLGHEAYGGDGGNGGKWDTDFTSSPGQYDVDEVSAGGDGGGNSAGLGSGGVRGTSGIWQTLFTPFPTPSDPGDGTWEVGGAYPVVGGGVGGGGGYGRVSNDESYTYHDSSDGADGAVGEYDAVGGLKFTNFGGGGGGLNPESWNDEDLRYGTHGSSSDTTDVAKGIVIIKLVEEPAA